MKPRQWQIPTELLSRPQWIAWWSVVGEGRRVQLPNGGRTGVLKARAKSHKLPIDPRISGPGMRNLPAPFRSPAPFLFGGSESGGMGRVIEISANVQLEDRNIARPACACAFTPVRRGCSGSAAGSAAAFPRVTPAKLRTTAASPQAWLASGPRSKPAKGGTGDGAEAGAVVPHGRAAGGRNGGAGTSPVRCGVDPGAEDGGAPVRISGVAPDAVRANRSGVVTGVHRQRAAATAGTAGLGPALCGAASIPARSAAGAVRRVAASKTREHVAGTATEDWPSRHSTGAARRVECRWQMPVGVERAVYALEQCLAKYMITNST